jgi:NADPH-dependent curcumin reductase CurA
MEQYMEPVKIGDVMRAAGSIAVVEVSNAEGVNVGDVIQGGLYGGWQEYFLMPGEKVIKIPVNMGLPLPAFFVSIRFYRTDCLFLFTRCGKTKVW